MAATRARVASALPLLLRLLLAVACAAPGTRAAYDPSMVVANIKSGCPVPNVEWPPEQYSLTTLVSLFVPLLPSITRADCQQQAGSLASCAFDGSLAVKSGCCSSECATNMRKLSDMGCFPAMLNLLCEAPPAQAQQVAAFMPVLLGAAERCGNVPVPPAIVCPGGGKVIPTGFNGGALSGAEAEGAGAPAAEASMPEAGAAGMDAGTARDGVDATPALPGATP